MPIYKKLSSLPFVDLYVCLEGGARSHYRGSMQGLAKHPNIDLGDEYNEDIKNLAQYIRTNIHNDRMMAVYDNMRLRVAFINSSNGQKWVALRKVKSKPPRLDGLGFPPALVPHLRNLGNRDGLILVCGSTGQGKTTTCCSLLVEYLETHGGVGYTIEDPVEYDISGRHGEAGYCYQVEVQREREWEDALLSSLRCHPSYIFIGEVCTPDIANQLLRAASSGHMVIATLHGGSVFEGIEGLLQLAEQRVGERARQLLAASFTAVIHQSLTQHGLQSRFLIADNNGTQSMSIKNHIRDNKVGMIASVMDQQHALLMQTGQLFR